MRLDRIRQAWPKKVHEVRADIGIALDGDADRVVIVDENGAIVDGDQIMALIAESWHQDGRLAGGGIVATVMSNLGLERFLGGIGPRHCTAPRSATATSSSTCASTASMSAASSPATSCCRISRTTGDGLVSALQVLACVKRQDKPVSEVCRKFEPVPQLLKNVRFSGGKPLEDAAGQGGDRGRREPARRQPAAWSSAPPAPSR